MLDFPGAPARAARPTGPPRCSAEPPFRSVELGEQLCRHMRAVATEVFAQLGDFLAPQGRVDREECRERLWREIESLQIEVFRARQATDGGVARAGAAATTLEHPGEHPQILAKSRPEELAVGVAPEPVDVVDARRPCQLPADLQPVSPVVAE